jgi:hypothetical protein
LNLQPVRVDAHRIDQILNQRASFGRRGRLPQILEVEVGEQGGQLFKARGGDFALVALALDGGEYVLARLIAWLLMCCSPLETIGRC